MNSVFSVVLAELRRENNLSQRKVAADMGISQALLSHYENGLREPKLDFVVKVCDYYGVSADYILGREGKSDSADLKKLSDGLRELQALAESLLEESARPVKNQKIKP